MPEFVQMRAATRGEADLRFLCEMLVEAVAWRPGAERPTCEKVLANPDFARYLLDWGRQGDTGVIAEAAGAPVGAAWYRLFSEFDQGYGFVDVTVPELTIGVRTEARGTGVGTALLEALIARAQSERHPALSLSVEDQNPAVHLYERLAFVRFRRVGDAWTMRRTLAE